VCGDITDLALHDPGGASLSHHYYLVVNGTSASVTDDDVQSFFCTGMPRPRTATIARRMGISPRTVQRAVAWLIQNEFMAKAPRLGRDDLQEYDMAPLVRKLKPYALARIQFIQEKDFERVLDDNMDITRQPSAKENSGDVGRRLQQNQLMLVSRTADEL
jgi:hypothetical protein